MIFINRKTVSFTIDNINKICNTSLIFIFLQDMKFKHAFDFKMMEKVFNFREKSTF